MNDVGATRPKGTSIKDIHMKGEERVKPNADKSGQGGGEFSESGRLHYTCRHMI